MADWADEWAVKIARRASEAADATFYEREVDLAAPVIAQALRAARAEGIEAAADAISPFIDKARRQKAACRALAEDIEDDDRLMADIYGAEAQMAGRHLANIQEAHAAIRALLTKESGDA